MIIKTDKDLLGLTRIGQIVGNTLQEMIAALKPGITTRELDEIGSHALMRSRARSAPILVYKYPGVTCISINDEAAHGIPGDRVIQPGDLVNIDVSAELDGYFADTGASVPVAPVAGASQALCDSTRAALDAAEDERTKANEAEMVARDAARKQEEQLGRLTAEACAVRRAPSTARIARVVVSHAMVGRLFWASTACSGSCGT